MNLDNILATFSPEVRESTSMKEMVVLVQILLEQIDVTKQQLQATQVQMQSTQEQLVTRKNQKAGR